MKDLARTAKMAKNAVLNHDAYVQADAEAKNLDLARFRKKIQSQISSSDESDDDTGNF